MDCLRVDIGAASPRGHKWFLIKYSSQLRGPRRSEAGRSTAHPPRSGGHASARSAALEQVLFMAAPHQHCEECKQQVDTVTGVQLLRIEEEGAFAGLVGGSPSVSRESSRRPRRTDLAPRDAKFVTELVSGAGRPSESIGQWRMHAGRECSPSCCSWQG